MTAPTEHKPSHARSGMQYGRLCSAFVVFVAAFFIRAIYNHRYGLNDTGYFVWSWRHIAPLELFPILLLAIPFFLAQWLYKPKPALLAIPLLLLMLCSFLLMLEFCYLQSAPHSWRNIANFINNPADNGYIHEAVKIVARGQSIGQLLHEYPRYLPTAVGHVYNKPPGLVLLSIAFVRIFGVDYPASLACGIFIADLAALSVGAAFLFIRYFTANRDAAFYGASFMALCPGFLLYFPQFDQCYPLFTALLCVWWAVALKANSRILSACFGFLFAAVLFVTYLPAALVVFFAGCAAFANAEFDLPFRRIASHIAVAIAAFAAFYALLWLATGFDPIATFREASHQEHLHLARYYAGGNLPRTMPGIIPWNFYNFAIGTGWISFLIVFFYFLSPDTPPRRRVVFLCLAQILIVGLSGLIGPETWRLWLFLMPMLMVPLGLEMSKWSLGARLAVYAALLLLTTVMFQSLLFMF
jgi:hypothetical protein